MSIYVLNKIKKITDITSQIQMISSKADTYKNKLGDLEEYLEDLTDQVRDIVGDEIVDYIGDDIYTDLNSILVFVQKLISDELENNNKLNLNVLEEESEETDKIDDYFKIPKETQENIIYRILKENRDKNLDIILSYEEIEEISVKKYGIKISSAITIGKMVKDGIIEILQVENKNINLNIFRILKELK